MRLQSDACKISVLAGRYEDRDIVPRDVISRKLIPPRRDERIFFIRHALRAGFTIEDIFNLTKIDR